MRGAVHLAWRQARRRWIRTALLVAAVSVSLYVPLVSRLVTSRFDAGLQSRAASTPLVLGTAGSRFDLVLESLFFRRAERTSIQVAFAERVAAMEQGLVVPLHLRHSVRGRPLVGTSPEYFDARGLSLGDGDLPAFVGDIVLGAAVARHLGLGSGDRVFADPPQLYDLSQPAAMELLVTGVLAPAGTSDDTAVFADVRTAWALDGHLHGHESSETLRAQDPDLVLGEADGQVALSGALIEDNRFEQDRASSFHLHGDPSKLPLSSLLVFAESAEDRTILKARINDMPGHQAERPSEVIEDLLAVVFRVRALLDRIAALLAGATAALIALVMGLSVKVRERELRTLDRIGAPRGFVTRLIAWELALVLLGGTLLALASAIVSSALLPDLITLL